MNWKQWVGALVALTVLIGTSWYVWTSLVWTDQAVESTDRDAGESPTSESSAKIILSGAKLTVANIVTVPVQIGDLQLTRTMPGRFVYDNTRHVALRVPADGVLLSVMAQVGDSVAKVMRLQCCRARLSVKLATKC